MSRNRDNTKSPKSLSLPTFSYESRNNILPTLLNVCFLIVQLLVFALTCFSVSAGTTVLATTTCTEDSKATTSTTTSSTCKATNDIIEENTEHKGEESSTTKSITNNKNIIFNNMRLAIFDLDYTIWQPEMYQIRGPPRLISIDDYEKKEKRKLSSAIIKETQTIKDNHVLIDRNGWLMQMFDGARYALEEIQRLQKEGHPVRAAIASKTDVPEWANICLDHMTLSDGTTLRNFIQTELIEIYYGSKNKHIQNLHQKTGIPYEEMCFFDNEYWNVEDVKAKLPAVKSYYTPDGMSREAWDDAMKAF